MADAIDCQERQTSNNCHPMPLAFDPLTHDRWPDLEDLFGKDKGANSGCWCMWPRVSATAFNAMSKDERKRAFRKLVRSDAVAGLLAYEAGQAIAWVAVGPRRDVVRFNTTKTSKSDEEEARLYAVTCFYVRTGHRQAARRLFVNNRRRRRAGNPRRVSVAGINRRLLSTGYPGRPPALSADGRWRKSR